MAIQPFGIKIKEKKERRKKRKWLTVSTAINIILLIITLISVSTTFYFSYQNQELQNVLYNFKPIIYSNSTQSTELKNWFFDVNDSRVILDGFVDIDLKVVSPSDGLLTISVTGIQLDSTHDSTTHYFNQSLAKYYDVSYEYKKQYQYFITKNVVNPITDKLAVRTILYLNEGVFQETFKDRGNDTITGIGFPLGEISFNATLHQAQVNQDYSQSFTEAVHCTIKTNV